RAVERETRRKAELESRRSAASAEVDRKEQEVEGYRSAATMAARDAALADSHAAIDQQMSSLSSDSQLTSAQGILRGCLELRRGAIRELEARAADLKAER